MTVKIRLARGGAKKSPFYRIVVADSRFRRDGRINEKIGYYNPLTEPETIEVKLDRVEHWVSHGAQMTDTVKKLVRKYKNKVAGK